MSFLRLIVCLVLFLAICEAACPHRSFLRKHLCTNCRNNAASAATFATGVDAWRERRRRRYNPRAQRVTTNTVFIGSGHFYPRFRTEPGDLCIFRRAAPKYVCTLNGNAWGCTPHGTELAVHSQRTGHYFH